MMDLIFLDVKQRDFHIQSKDYESRFSEKMRQSLATLYISLAELESYVGFLFMASGKT